MSPLSICVWNSKHLSGAYRTSICYKGVSAWQQLYYMWNNSKYYSDNNLTYTARWVGFAVSKWHCRALWIYAISKRLKLFIHMDNIWCEPDCNIYSRIFQVRWLAQQTQHTHTHKLHATHQLTHMVWHTQPHKLGIAIHCSIIKWIIIVSADGTLKHTDWQCNIYIANKDRVPW